MSSAMRRAMPVTRFCHGVMGITFCSERFEKRRQPTRLTLATYHAQQAQAAQVLKSEQPHLGKNSCQSTMGWSDRMGVRQNGNTDQRPLRVFSRSSLPRRNFERSSNPRANVRSTPPHSPPITLCLVDGRDRSRSPFRQKGPTRNGGQLRVDEVTLTHHCRASNTLIDLDNHDRVIAVERFGFIGNAVLLSQRLEPSKGIRFHGVLTT